MAAFSLFSVGNAFAWAPIDVLLACVAEIRVEGQIETESGTENGIEYARIIKNKNVSKREAKRVNTCADYSGGYSGLNLIAPKNAVARVAVSYAEPNSTAPVSPAADPDAPHPLCVKGGGVMQRGGLICVGH